TLESLVNAGASPDGVVSANQPTPLMMAAYAGDARAVRFLLDRGANPNLTGLNGYSALGFAAGSEFQNADVVQMLLKAGADPTYKDRDGLVATEWAARRGKTGVTRLLPAVDAPVDDAAGTAQGSVRDAVQRAVRVLQSAGAAFSEKNT